MQTHGDEKTRRSADGAHHRPLGELLLHEPPVDWACHSRRIIEARWNRKPGDCNLWASRRLVECWNGYFGQLPQAAMIINKSLTFIVPSLLASAGPLAAPHWLSTKSKSLTFTAPSFVTSAGHGSVSATR